MKYPISVFLDSNQFIRSKYNFGENSPLGILRKMVVEDKIKVFTCEIVVHEVLRHIEEDSKKAVNKVIAVRGELSKLVSRELTKGTDLDSLFDDINKSAVITSHKTKFEKYLVDVKAEILNSEGVEVQKLVNDYFNTVPPFQIGEKKKYEFPDAIMSHKLKSRFGLSNPIIVVSNDKGFIKSFSDFPGITSLRDVREVLNQINKVETNLYSMISQYTKTNEFESDFTDLMISQIKSRENIVDGLDCDRKGYCSGHQYDYSEITNVNLIEIKLKTLNKIESDIYNITLVCTVEIEAFCSFDDYDEAIYDKEDGKYFNVESVSVIENHKADIECDVDFVMIKKHDKIEAKIHDIDFSLELDSYTLQDRKYYSPKAEEQFESELMDTYEDYYRHK